jgi:hypothetical protein
MSGETLVSGLSTADGDHVSDVSATANRRAAAIAIAVAPLVLLAAFIAHPYIGLGLPDQAAVARAAASNTVRWGIAHLMVAVASGLLLLAFVAIRAYLRDAGEQRWSARGLPLVIVAGTLYAVLPGMEFAALAAVETGGDVRAAQAAVEPWFIPVILASGLAWAIGVVGFAKGLSSIGPRAHGVPGFVVVALAAMGVSRMIPLTAVQFYVHAAAALIALWPLAYVMWRQPKVMQAAHS